MPPIALGLALLVDRRSVGTSDWIPYGMAAYFVALMLVLLSDLIRIGFALLNGAEVGETKRFPRTVLFGGNGKPLPRAFAAVYGIIALMSAVGLLLAAVVVGRAFTG